MCGRGEGEESVIGDLGFYCSALSSFLQTWLFLMLKVLGQEAKRLPQKTSSWLARIATCTHA